MLETHNATQGKSADYPDPAEYLGCLEAKEKRRACYDDRCACRETCRLWTERDSPGYAVKGLTWRRHYECHNLPCDYWQAAEAPLERG